MKKKITAGKSPSGDLPAADEVLSFVE